MDLPEQINTAANAEKNAVEPAYSPITLITIAVLLTFLLLGIMLSSREFVERQIRDDSQRLLATHKQSINNTIERLRHLPISAARDKDVIALLETAYKRDYEKVAASSAATNFYLESIAKAANASLFYVIDVFGNTIASSNWRLETSLVNKSFSYRPYFKDSINGREAKYFAIGTSTNEAGYYFAQPVMGNTGVIGIVVVKTELESLQAQWAEGGDNLILFDEQDVSVLASSQLWRFRTLSNELPDNLSTLRDENKYAGKDLAPLKPNIDITSDSIRLDGTHYLVSQTLLPERGWRLWHLESSQRVNTATWLAGLASLLLLGLSAVLYLYRRENIRKNKLREAARDAENMRQLNQQLETEIAERKQAQHELETTQAELMQAGKLAALGQMSAAIVHEVNQPLAAIRTFGASAKLLLRRGDTNAVATNLEEINSLTERLATITTELKIFARKPGVSRNRLCLQECIHSVLNIFNSTLIEESVNIVLNLPDTPVYTLGSSIRLEQVISNLLSNAKDATKLRANNREIKLHLFVDTDEVVLRVSDNGEGLDHHTIQHLFDPFFTTKPSGEGVGLGLAISYGIVQEMGGVIRVQNNAEGGALFSLRLPLADWDSNYYSHFLKKTN